MDDSKRLAGLVGPTLIALSLSEALSPRIWEGVSVTQIYLAGTLWFIAGLSIIRAHNRWNPYWPIVITLVGWFALLGGLFRMFAPEFAQKNVPNPSAILLTQALIFVIGVFLTIKAQSRTNDR